MCQERFDKTAFRVSIIVTQVKLCLAGLDIIVGPKLADGLWKRPQRSHLVTRMSDKKKHTNRKTVLDASQLFKAET